MNSHRQRARKKTVVWQAASLALVGSAIGLAALPIAEVLGPGEHRKPKAAAIDAGTFKPETMSSVQLIKTADALRTISGKVEVARRDPVPEPEPGPDAAAATEAPAPPSTWAYTGYMRGPNIKKAIITIGPIEGGLQLMLAEGQEHERTKLTEIHPDHILIEEGGKQQRVDLQTRSLAWDTSPPRRPMPPRAPGAPGSNPAAAAAAGMSQPGFAAPNAAAMAEAQRRMKAAISPTPAAAPMPEMHAKEFDQDRRDAVAKVMSEPGLSPEERAGLLREMGIPVDASPEEQQEFLRNMGIDEQTDPKLYEMIKSGGGSK